MKNDIGSSEFSEQNILNDLIEILENMTLDWEMEFNDPIGLDTRLINDLEFESIDVVQFIVAIEEHYQRRGLPFEELLMVNGRYVDEIKVGDSVSFLARYLTAN